MYVCILKVPSDWVCIVKCSLPVKRNGSLVQESTNDPLIGIENDWVASANAIAGSAAAARSPQMAARTNRPAQRGELFIYPYLPTWNWLTALSSFVQTSVEIDSDTAEPAKARV
jgi:hypothetical protein